MIYHSNLTETDAGRIGSFYGKTAEERREYLGLESLAGVARTNPLGDLVQMAERARKAEQLSIFNEAA